MCRVKTWTFSRYWIGSPSVYTDSGVLNSCSTSSWRYLRDEETRDPRTSGGSYPLVVYMD